MGGEALQRVRQNLETVIQGKRNTIELLLTALCANGHALIEDVPGVGKTTLAKALARSIDCAFHRVQFTPDLLPADITGSLYYNPKDTEFFFREGPIFTNIMLADEINRASPRVQSALLEAMSENQVSVDGKPRELCSPFMVIATENPVEHHGTYPLPESQLDRFAMRLEMGYPTEEEELDVLLKRKVTDPLDNVKPVINGEGIAAIQREVRQIEIESSVSRYMLALTRATREDPRVKLGGSPRALLSLSRCAQALAYIRGRDYALPDDVKLLAEPVMAHRLVLDNKAKYQGANKSEVIRDTLEKIPVPT